MHVWVLEELSRANGKPFWIPTDRHYVSATEAFDAMLELAQKPLIRSLGKKLRIKKYERVK